MKLFNYLCLCIITLLSTAYAYQYNNGRDYYELLTSAVSNDDTIKFCGKNAMYDAIWACCNNDFKSYLKIYNSAHGD